MHASLQEILQLRATLALRTHHAKQAKRDVLAARDELADARRREGALARELEASRAAAAVQREAAAADGEAAACAARCAAAAVLGAVHALRSAEQRAEAEQLASQCADLAARLGRESASLAEAAAAAGRAEARAALELETRLDLERRVAQAEEGLGASEGGRAGPDQSLIQSDGVERRALALRMEQLEKELRAAKTRAERAERLAQSHDAAALDLEITLSAAERGLREAEARCAAALGERDAALANCRAAEEALEAETWRSCGLQEAVLELHDRALLLERPSQAPDEVAGAVESPPATSPSAVPARSLEAALHAMRRLRAEKDALVETVKKLQAALKLQLARYRGIFFPPIAVGLAAKLALIVLKSMPSRAYAGTIVTTITVRSLSPSPNCSAPAATSPAPTTTTQRSERARRPHISLPAEGSQQDDSENLASQRGQKTPHSSRAGPGPVPFSPAQSHNLAGQHAWASPVAKHASPVGPAGSARFSMR